MPPVAVTVNAYPPATAVPLVTVKVDDPEPGREAGLNDAVAPAGNPLTCRVMGPANPVAAVTVAVYAALPPARTELRIGDVLSEKSGTVIVRDAGCGSVTP